jgi:hypothetical protein
MNKIKQFQIFFILMLVLAAAGGTDAQEIRIFAAAEVAKGGDLHPERWRFQTNHGSYEVSDSGRGTRRVNPGSAGGFKIKLDRYENITHVYFADLDNDILMLCESELGDGASGFIMRLDGKTLKTEWRRHIPGFNVTPGLIEGKYAYLGAIGFAAKIDLGTGTYIWEHPDFYRTYDESGAFGGFDSLEIKGVEIVYTEKDVISGRTNVIKFDKETGKIIKVILG